MSKILTEAEIRVLVAGWGEFDREHIESLAHTALEAMRERDVLRGFLAEYWGQPCLMPLGGGLRCQEPDTHLWPDGGTSCPTHAPAGSVRVVP